MELGNFGKAKLETAQRDFDKNLRTILNEVEEAKSANLPVAEVDRVIEMQHHIEEKANEGKMSIVEYMRQALNLDAILEPASVKFDSITEVAACLRALSKDEELIRDYLAHENAHMSKALEHEMRGYYLLTFAQNDDGSYSIYARTKTWDPKGRPAQELRKIMAEVALAPGDDDPGDKARARRLFGSIN